MRNLKLACPAFALAFLAFPVVASATAWINLGGTFDPNIAPGMSKGLEVNTTYPNQATVNAYYVDVYSHAIVNYETAAVDYAPVRTSYLHGQTWYAPSAVQWTNHREVVVVGGDNVLYYSTSDSDGPFTNWAPAGYLTSQGPNWPSVCSDPSAVSWGPGRVDVFVLGCDGDVYQATHLNGEWNWASRGTGAYGMSSSAPVAASSNGARLDVWTGLQGLVEDDQYNGSGWTGRVAYPPNDMWSLSSAPIHANGGSNVISGAVVGFDNGNQVVGFGDDMWASHGFTNVAGSGITNWGPLSTATRSNNSIVVYAVDSQQHVARARLQFSGFNASWVLPNYNNLATDPGDVFQGRVGVETGLTEDGNEPIIVFAIKSNGNLWYAPDRNN
jgi:hypothetical protein